MRDQWLTLFLLGVQMVVASMQVPTLDEVTKKEQSIKEAMNHKFNDKDIEDVSVLSSSSPTIPSVPFLLPSMFSPSYHTEAPQRITVFCLFGLFFNCTVADDRS